MKAHNNSINDIDVYPMDMRQFKAFFLGQTNKQINTFLPQYRPKQDIYLPHISRFNVLIRIND